MTSNCTTDDRYGQHPPIFKHKGYQLTAKAWQQMLTAHEAQHGPMPQAMLKTSGIRIAIDIVVADAGATSHFVLPGTLVTNVQPAKTTLVISLPDG